MTMTRRTAYSILIEHPISWIHRNIHRSRAIDHRAVLTHPNTSNARPDTNFNQARTSSTGRRRPRPRVQRRQLIHQILHHRARPLLPTRPVRRRPAPRPRAARRPLLTRTRTRIRSGRPDGDEHARDALVPRRDAAQRLAPSPRLLVLARLEEGGAARGVCDEGAAARALDGEDVRLEGEGVGELSGWGVVSRA